MLRLPPRSTRTDTLFPYTTLFRSFAGQIDRLAVADDGILMVDYKSNRPPPATAERVAPVYLRQMAAYRALLREIYPGLAVRCALSWTETPRLMPLPGALPDRPAPGA